MEYIYKDQIIVSSNNKKGAGGGGGSHLAIVKHLSYISKPI